MKVAQHQEVSAEVELREQVIFCVNLFTGELVHTFPGEYRPGFQLKGICSDRQRECSLFLCQTQGVCSALTPLCSLIGNLTWKVALSQLLRKYSSTSYIVIV